MYVYAHSIYVGHGLLEIRVVGAQLLLDGAAAGAAARPGQRAVLLRHRRTGRSQLSVDPFNF